MSSHFGNQTNLEIIHIGVNTTFLMSAGAFSFPILPDFWIPEICMKNARANSLLEKRGHVLLVTLRSDLEKFDRRPIRPTRQESSCISYFFPHST